MNMTTMTKGLSKFVLRTSVALPLVLAPAVSVTVLEAVGVSAPFAKAEAAEETRKVPSIREKVSKKLGKAQEAAEAEKWNEALAALRDMEAGKSGYNGYEVAMMYYFYGFVYYSMERYPQAITAYKNVLKQGSDNLTEALEVGTLLTVAQLYLATENYDQGLNYLNKWFAAAAPDQITADSYSLRAQAYYQKGDEGKALSDINTAVSMYEKEGKVPKENWFGLQRFLYFEKNDYKKVTSILEKLAKHYPKGEYYKQLAGMYGELKREKDQLHMMEAAYIAGALEKEKELLNMAYLFMGHDVPYKAAKVLKKGLDGKKIKRTAKNLELLAQAYQMAQELQKSIPELEAAAKLSDKGEIYYRLAGIYLDLDKNEKAIEVGNRALKKGGVKRQDQLQIVLGMANANLKKYDTAVKHFKVAKKDDRSKKMATQWLSFIENEKEREEQLAI